MGAGCSSISEAERIKAIPIKKSANRSETSLGVSIDHRSSVDSEDKSKSPSKTRLICAASTTISSSLSPEESVKRDKKDKKYKLNIKKDIVVPKGPPSNYKKGQLIGQGTLGKVHQCLSLNTGEIFVAKTISVSGRLEMIRSSVETLNQEVRTLNRLLHPNIVRYIATEMVQASPEIVEIDIIIEFISGGSLKDCVSKFGRFEEKVACLYMSQILEALAFLHSKNMIHRDLKCSNILVDSSGTIKLSDFGYFKGLEKEGQNTDGAKSESVKLPSSMKGSSYWMAPEVIISECITPKSDIWSVGCVLIEMLTGRPPWSDKAKNTTQVYNMVKSKASPTLPANISRICKDFILKALTFDHKERPSAEELLDHPFIKAARCFGASDSLISCDPFSSKDIMSIEKPSNLHISYGSMQFASLACSPNNKINDSDIQRNILDVFNTGASPRRIHSSSPIRQITNLNQKNAFFAPHTVAEIDAISKKSQSHREMNLDNIDEIDESS